MGEKSLKKTIRSLCAYIMIFCVLCNSLLAPVMAGTPEVKNVVVGDVTFTIDSNNTIVNIASDKAVIDWKNMDTLKGELLQFIQLNSNSAVLNKIMTGQPTQLDRKSVV